MNTDRLHTRPETEEKNNCCCRDAYRRRGPVVAATPWGGLGEEGYDSGRQAVRAALVLADLTRDMVKGNGGKGHGDVVLEALEYAAIRILHWLKEASRCGQHQARLRCLAEAACANMAFRGLMYEQSGTGGVAPRRAELLLSRSRQLGGFIGGLCELTGKATALAHHEVGFRSAGRRGRSKVGG